MSILVDLLSCFRDKPENIATRGLHSVLKRPEVRLRLNAFLKLRFNWNLAIAEIDRQVKGAGGQPDLQGVDATGQKIFFAEVKFRAGLTHNQPISYLQMLSPGGLLLFIAPKAQRARLWLELQEKLHDKDLEGYKLDKVTDSSKRLIEVDGKYLAFVTASDLLDAFLDTTEQQGQTEASSDIRQLQALFQAYDVPDLPPVDEVTTKDAGLACLILGLTDLPKKIAVAFDSNVNASAKSSAGCTYVDQVEVGGFKGWLIYSPPNWKQYGCSPIWFETMNKSQYVFDPARWEAIRSTFAGRAGQICNQPLVSKSFRSYPDAIAVPLTIKPNSIESKVVSDIVEQLRSLAHRIETFRVAEPSGVSQSFL